MWDLIVAVPDHCLSFTLFENQKVVMNSLLASFHQGNVSLFGNSTNN